ncbi:tyrosine-protein kinase family protein [Armatimonas rosea]|uniref:Mrp family chromosome partitioning ATPase n=1 Tax=Armatimonas rosea TaxID=685828 RepID=A0A7W9SSC3_ARMRO|nr:CpsD/CapB family tyrosine-protein kinase [Armatimonas rosea]MBB6051956.1 Mrp family chromosome partitioning ATPase [Armatimonas rosea]
MRIPGLRGRRLESAEKAKKELGIPLLGELPQPSAGAQRLEIAYTHLMESILLKAGQGEASRVSIAVTSTREGEGRSSVAANLAIAATRLGRSVLLVDTESSNPRQHRIFGGEFASQEPGLLDLLAMAVTSPSEVLQETTIPRLRLLPVGDTLTHDASVLFSPTGSHQRLERFIRSIAPRLADVVIFDTPYVLSHEPGRHVLSHTDGVVFVVGLGETEASAARKALGILESREASLLGAVCLTLGDFSRSMAVPLPEVTLQKPEKETEILGNNVLTVEVPSPRVSETSPIVPPSVPIDNAKVEVNDSDGKSMSVAAQKQDDDQSTAPAGGFGVEDLEAVLQGWRRRDTTPSPEPERKEEPMGIGIPLPPSFNVASDEGETVSEGAAPVGVAFPMGNFGGGGEGVPIPIPFLSVATNQEPSVEETAEAPKPILTIVEGPSEAETEVAKTEPEVEVVAVPELVVPHIEPVEAVVVAEEEIMIPVPVAPVVAVAELEEAVPVVERESVSIPVVPVFPVPVMAAEAPVAPAPAPEPVVVVAPEPVMVAPVWPTVAPTPVAVVPQPEPVVAAPAPVAPVEVPPPAPAAPVYVQPAPAPVAAAPAYTPAPAPAFAPPPVLAPPVVAAAPLAASVAPQANRSALDMQIDMFQTGPGEMTMRAATSNAPAVGVPPVSLELAMAMNAMRGMRAITPSSTGGADQPRIALEAVSTDAPEATRMRLVVGSTHEPALEVVVHNGAGISVRTGSGMEQPSVKLDSQNLPDGGTVTRATLHTARGGQELVLELRREAVNDGFTDARWKNRLSLFA